MTIPEIAIKLHTTNDAIKQLLARARRKLRKEIRKRGYEYVDLV